MGIRCWDPLQTGMRCLLAAHLPFQVTEMLPGCVPLQQDPVVGEKLILSLFSLQQGEKLHPLSAGRRYRVSGCCWMLMDLL